MKRFILAVLLICQISGLFSQERKDNYIAPTDQKVKQNIAEWQDLKFGLFMHWGTYSQWGVVESWSICPEDEGWTQRRGEYSKDYFTYKKAYENLQTTFNPVGFNPEKWVKAAKDAGMGYVVFTTKHHDGFCMFDTKQTDYKITSPKTPFSQNPRSNIAKEIFDAFRKQDFKIGAYFSKPDWHSDDFWWPYFPPKDRNPNYNPVKYPERWNNFKNFTYKQIEELMTGYGKMDILWLDGDEVRPVKTSVKGVNESDSKLYDQDIDMPKIAAMARANQPGLIIVDREVPGEFENYRTPEQQVPDKPLPYPWETCMTMGGSWSYSPNDTYKSAKTLVQLLIKIVSRGGNLLLNIGPGPNGDWAPEAYERLRDIGSWIKINGEGIYGSKAVEPYASGNQFYTQSKNKKEIFAFLLSDNDEVQLPAEVNIPFTASKTVKKISLLGEQQILKWDISNGILKVNVPAGIQQNKTLKYAAAFKIEYY